MASQREMIRDKAVELLRDNPEGLRFGQLRDAVRQNFPATSVGSISRVVSRLHTTRSSEVDKPSRGFFKYRFAGEGPIKPVEQGVPKQSKKRLVRDKAVELLKARPEGLRFAELRNALGGLFPGSTPGTIASYIWNLDVSRSGQVEKPSKGLFKYSLPPESATVIEKPKVKTFQEPAEQDFYGRFAGWIRDDLGECTEAVAFGGHYLGKKWGTPDVIGIYKPSLRDVVKFEPEIISAEVKINPSDPVTAFGQAIAYRLFSSKVYLVEPKTMLPEDQDRVEGLCILFGVGLVLFDVDVENPNFAIRVRAQSYSPTCSM